MTDGRLNILLVSAHGLIRAHAPELGRNPDTGGQVLYVLEPPPAAGSRMTAPGPRGLPEGVRHR